MMNIEWEQTAKRGCIYLDELARRALVIGLDHKGKSL